MTPLRQHPNAIVGGLLGGSGLGTALVQLLDQTRFGHSLPDYAKTAIVGGAAAGVMFVGRNGAVGTWRRVKQLVLHGTGSAS